MSNAGDASIPLILAATAFEFASYIVNTFKQNGFLRGIRTLIQVVCVRARVLVCGARFTEQHVLLV